MIHELAPEDQARLVEMDAWLNEVWQDGALRHDLPCPMRHQVGTECTCWVADVNWLLELVRGPRPLKGCEARKIEGKRSWICQLPKGHERHRSISGRRVWDEDEGD